MNLIYSLRYSKVAGCLIAVSELAKKKTKKKIRTALLTSSMTAILVSGNSFAGTVNNELPYQTFRDFAENKGAFQPGATNIPIYNKAGTLVGTLDKAPMPDFSAVDSVMGVATLIDPQYIVSVQHNGGYQGVSFGDGKNYYSIVDRNNAGRLDFHIPRLNKLVTEVTPTPVTSQGAVNGAYLNKKRYPVFYRLGSGNQYIKDSNNVLNHLTGAYTWLTGGTVGSPSSYQNGEMITSSSGLVFDYRLNDALPIYGEAGDSGSPIFAWDTTLQKWVLVGVLTAGNGPGGRANNWSVIPLDFVQNKIKEDDGPFVISDSSIAEPFTWTFDSKTGKGTLKQRDVTYEMQGQKGADLNAGKNIFFSGKNGKVNLEDDVIQGAGYLRFLGNYIVTTASNSIWTGAGIIVDKLLTVNWQLNGLKGDNLHKIGEGTLIVEGNGINEGGLKVGAGTVVLNQQPNEEGSTQAFSSVNIAGGTSSVVLSNERQINPDNVSWGYRGGKLDLNGTDATFHKLNAADYGAVLANDDNENISTITFDYQLKPSDVKIHQWNSSKRGTVGDFYEYDNNYTQTKDYFILKQERYNFFPTSQNSDSNWEYVGHDLDAAQKLIAKRTNDKGYVFHGRLEGNMNVENRVSSEYEGAFVLDGSANIKGTFTQDNGRLVLQGHPVIHAFNSQQTATHLSAKGDDSVRTQPTSFEQKDWGNRDFTFGQLLLNNAYLGLARNATLNANLDANNSVVALGDDKVFIDRKDGKGTAFSLEEGSSVAEEESDKSVFNGHATLKGDTKFNILNTVFNGTISGDAASRMQLDRRGKWNMTGDSSLGKFASHGGSLSLLGSDWKPKTLRINEMDATDMHISLGADVSKEIGDRIDIIEHAQGQNNILDVSLFFDEDARLKNDLTVVSAPAGTAHDMFSFGSFTRGFSDFTPETKVQEASGKVMWQLAKVVPSNEEENRSSPQQPDHETPSVEDNTPEPEKGVAEDISESTTGPSVKDVVKESSETSDDATHDTEPGSVEAQGGVSVDAGHAELTPPPLSEETSNASEVSAGGTDEEVLSKEVLAQNSSQADESADKSIPKVDGQPGSGSGSKPTQEGTTEKADGEKSQIDSKPGDEENKFSEPEEVAKAEGAASEEVNVSETEPKEGQPESQDKASTEAESKDEASVEKDISMPRKANTALLNKARDTFISHEYILSDRVDYWQQVVDAATANGAWAFTEQSYGKHGDFTLNQSTLNIGFKKSHDSGAWWGFGTDLNHGQVKADDYRNSFKLWGVNVYAGQQLSNGLFVDGTVGFSQLTEDYKVHGKLSDLSGKVKTHAFTGGLRTGYKFNFESADLSIIPTVSLNGIKTSDGRLKGKGRSVELRGGDALWLKTGIEAEKKIKDIKLKAGVWRNTNLNEMPGISLSDNWSQHQYKSENLERITSSVGVEGKATENLHIKAGANAKFDGYFKNNYEGIFGIRYEF
ncbi:S6 family peptidase [Cronobacter malonaticus]|uniref:S6 family peptidase n=1 Tax=Cronobacter malonaticus TaxID=413503 RepID=UPI000CFE3759|nr:S6 family peptidase [Cronobacter malonaticus]